ncbi:MAG TPA: hydroxymethylglutaryl-CoA lyase [Clostridiaceae bacterium]|nr:hydroxymethylglutaryl-CoA lyase [Clostridiaceae bacterium]
MKLPENVILCEVGLRDGLQNEEEILPLETKVSWARAIARSGFPVIELGSFVSPRAVPQMADTDELFSALAGVERVELRALVANERGVERAAQCGCRKVKLNVSASRRHNLANLNRTPEESIDGFSSCVQLAQESGIEVSGSISMPFGSPWERQIPFADVEGMIRAYRELGIREVSLSDTSGMATPAQVYDLSVRIQESWPDMIWWMHFHNTRGLALANILAAMQAGLNRFDTSFAGLGGCPFVPGAAGNVATEDALHMFLEMGISTGIDLDACIEIGRMAASRFERSESYILRAGKSSDLIR